MSKILEQHNISLLEGARKDDSHDNIEYHETCHALKAVFSKSHAFLIDSRASNHMLASKESFYSLKLTDGTSIHMGDDTQIQVEWKGSIKLEHGVFKNVHYVTSLALNLLFVYLLTQKNVHLVVHGLKYIHTSYSYHISLNFDLHNCISTKNGLKH